MTDPSHASSRFPGALRRFGPAGFALLLAMYFFAPASEVLTTNLDSSNYGSYSAFTAEGRQYGTEVIPMVGPYGFVLYGTTYTGQLYSARIVLEFLVKFAFGLLIVWFFRDARSPVVRWIWLAALLLILPGGRELAYDLTVLFAGLFAVLNSARPERRAGSYAAMVVLAFLALTKGTLLVFGLATAGVVALHALADRDFRRLARFLGVYFVALLGFWLLAGQNPLHLPAYVHGISELSRGYNDAMGLQEPPAIFFVGLGCLALFGLVLVAVGWTQRRQVPVLLAVLLMGGFSFLKWKHGFVRADGHYFLFFFYAVIGALTAWLVSRSTAADLTAARGPASWGVGLLVAACVGLGYYGPGVNPFAFAAWQFRLAAAQAPGNFSGLLFPQAAQRRLDAALDENRLSLALPDTRRIVGRSTIDFFGIELAYIPFNELASHPRPMSGGSYGVFTPDLQARNERFVTDQRTRPDFYLLKLDTIDNRLTAADDASTLLALIHGYRPVAAEQGMLLLQARAESRELPVPRLLSSRSFKFREGVAPPAVADDEMLLVSFRFPPSWRGRIRSALYKPSAVFLSFDGKSLNEPGSRRLVPSLVERPVLLGPLLEDSGDFLAPYSAGSGKRVWQFWVFAQLPECFDEANLSVTFYAVPRPPALSPAVSQALVAALRYPMSNRIPEQAGPVFRMPNGLPVQRVEAPGRIDFPLDGQERAVDFEYGLDPECYTRGVTDGVDFSIELQQPDGPVQLLFQQSLHPLTVAADRGPHRHRLILPPVIRPRSHLSFRTGPGSRGDSAWDWAYFARMHFQAGPLLAEQFPGFSTAPAAMDAAYCGALALGDGTTVFMLNAPGLLTFSLDGTARALSFAGGLIEGAYTQGNTDGAEFVVELERADGRREELLRRWLQPKTVPGDRGRQAFTVALPVHSAGDRLHLRTLPGPAGSNAWDWTYLSQLTLR